MIKRFGGAYNLLFIKFINVNQKKLNISNVQKNKDKVRYFKKPKRVLKIIRI